MPNNTLHGKKKWFIQWKENDIIKWNYKKKYYLLLISLTFRLYSMVAFDTEKMRDSTTQTLLSLIYFANGLGVQYNKLVEYNKSC